MPPCYRSGADAPERTRSIQFLRDSTPFSDVNGCGEEALFLLNSSGWVPRLNLAGPLQPVPALPDLPVTGVIRIAALPRYAPSGALDKGSVTLYPPYQFRSGTETDPRFQSRVMGKNPERLASALWLRKDEANTAISFSPSSYFIPNLARLWQVIPAESPVRFMSFWI